ncbi:5-deoxy-glucuronate isomerase [Sporosarcina sp.]|uniref:5-deoxy-glucuronate isomerase n=1 Tax=Sporosarcina sp. TaxID=49982 RepID=UPI00260B82EE|nr:5-deoxy-glucuronate isomerase [Sporosarcina sp.]
MTSTSTQQTMKNWHLKSTEEEGFHKVVDPGREDCSAVHIFRLNLSAGNSYMINSLDLEMNGVLLKGTANIKSECIDQKMSVYDSFYIPGNSSVNVTAIEDTIFYIGGALCEGHGKEFYRAYNKDLPLGEIHQIHGAGSGQREVHFTLNPEVPASKLICGLTWGGDGTWTSWPPHQHENDLEEVYCYFDMDEPKFGLHISYLKTQETDNLVAHHVTSGDMVLVPRGYHPTVASPGTRNTYFWVLAAFSHSSRRYDLAVFDPTFEDM